MRWRGRRQSGNVEDRRGMRAGRGGGGGIIGAAGIAACDIFAESDV